MDDVFTCSYGALTFEPAEARRIAERLEIYYTPKHGSWLDMAEIAVWEEKRNQEATVVNWRFTPMMRELN